MLYSSDKKRMKLAYIASVVCIAFFLYLTLSNINQAERETKKVSVALKNLYRLANVLTDVHAVETGQRGYVITGDETYLFTYNRGLDSIVQNIDMIIPDSADSRLTGRDKELLLDLIRQKVLHAKKVVDIRTRFGRDSATTVLKNSSGEILMNRIRVRVNSLETTLHNEISRSNAKRESTIKRIAAEFLILGLIIYLILFFNYRVISKELKIRRKNEEILKFNGTLISSIIDPIITTDLHHRITNWNKHAEELYGWPEHEVIGKNLEELLQIEYADIDMEKARQQFAEQGYWKGETIHTSRKGKKLHILSSISAVNNDEGKTVSVVGVYTDVTDKKETEQRLKLLTDNLEIEVERKAHELNSVFERITDAFIALDEKWNYTYVNIRAAEMHGRSVEELVGKNIWELFPEQVGSEFYNALHKAVETGVSSKRQLYHANSSRWFEDLIYPGPNGVSVYYHDITEKKNAELKLQEAHDKLHSHINNTPIAVLEFDKDLQIVQWSPKATEIFGWQQEEVSQPGFTIFDMVYAGDLARITETTQQLLRNGKSETLDFRNVTRNDEVIYCEWYFSVLKNRSGETGIMALVHDITERRKTELALQETESKFRSLVEESLVGVYIIQKGKFTYVNPRFAEIVGYTVDEIENKVNVLDLVCDHDKEKVESNIKTRMFGIRKSMHYMFDAQHKSGKTLNVEVYGTFLLYKGEGAVIGTLIDVTERNKYLRMLEASEFEMKVLNERFELVGKATQDGIWDWDIHTGKVHW
ncbi:MAG: PAS domain S-box protein, partial [Chitinophagaceae bacterium]